MSFKMFAHKKKKSKLENQNSSSSITFKGVCVFILPFKVQKVRLEHMKMLARRKGFEVADMMSGKITHIVSEFATKDEVMEMLRNKYASVMSTSCEILSVQWFVDCMEANDALHVTDEYRLPLENNVDKTELCDDNTSTENNYKNAKYACQRSTLFCHPNRKLTDALEILEKHAELLSDDHNNARALAFRKASAALKAYPSAITAMSQVENLKDLRGGQHCKKVIQEILEEGFCSEVDKIVDSEWYKSMQIFTGVFGCGPVTGKKWYDKGCRTLDDVKKHMSGSLTKEQKIGIECYNDLNTPVSELEAQVIREIVYDEAVEILAGTTVTITGGFSRGKDIGHDVDLLISHPVEGRECGLLHKLLSKLNSLHLLLYTNTKENNYSELMYSSTDAQRSHMDHYARCFSVFNLPKSSLVSSKSESGTSKNIAENENKTEQTLPKNITSNQDKPDQELKHSCETRVIRKHQSNTNNKEKQPPKSTPSYSTSSCVARRVDLIIVPASQYPYALLGWTGSRMFIRSIRDYSRKEMNMVLTSHGLFDKATNKLLPANNEREIFQQLQLEYREPWERNC